VIRGIAARRLAIVSALGGWNPGGPERRPRPRGCRRSEFPRPRPRRFACGPDRPRPPSSRLPLRGRRSRPPSGLVSLLAPRR